MVLTYLLTLSFMVLRVRDLGRVRRLGTRFSSSGSCIQLPIFMIPMHGYTGVDGVPGRVKEDNDMIAV